MNGFSIEPIEPREPNKAKSYLGTIIMALFVVLVLAVASLYIRENLTVSGSAKPLSLLSSRGYKCSTLKDMAWNGILCLPKSKELMPAVVAVGGNGSRAERAKQACEFFVERSLVCLALDSAGVVKGREEEVIKNIKEAVDYLKDRDDVDNNKISLWGGSNGGLTTLLAASERNDILALTPISAPLWYEYDDEKFERLQNLNSHLLYIYGEFDFTDTETSQALKNIVTRKNKLFKEIMIPDAGHEICCYDPKLLEEQYRFVKALY